MSLGRAKPTQAGPCLPAVASPDLVRGALGQAGGAASGSGKPKALLQGVRSP